MPLGELSSKNNLIVLGPKRHSPVAKPFQVMVYDMVLNENKSVLSPL